MTVCLCRYGIRGLLVDPYNELDHQRPSHMSETEYVSQMLTKIKRFAQHHDVHVWFVAHPRQLRDWKGQPPTMYDISGSAHFINKADNGLVIHRNRDPQAGPMNEVSIAILSMLFSLCSDVPDKAVCIRQARILHCPGQLSRARSPSSPVVVGSSTGQSRLTDAVLHVV